MGNQINGFLPNLAEGWGIGQERTHDILEQISARGLHLVFFFFLKISLFHVERHLN